MVHLSLAEYASTHRDGTFTVLRGGIEQWSTDALPAPISLWVWCEIPPKTLAQGDHALLLAARAHPDKTLFEASGVAQVVNEEKPMRFALPMQFAVDTYGTVQVDLSIGAQRGGLMLEVKRINEGKDG